MSPQPGASDPYDPTSPPPPMPAPGARPGGVPFPPVPQAPSRPAEQRREAEAALDSFVEMGPQWQAEVVDSFLARVDATTSSRWQESEYLRQQQIAKERAAQKARTRELVITLAFAIPLTGIASSAGIIGMLICWAGIAAVAFSLHLPHSDRHDRPHEPGR